jgi:hypothetical protein
VETSLFWYRYMQICMIKHGSMHAILQTSHRVVKHIFLRTALRSAQGCRRCRRTDITSVPLAVRLDYVLR